MGKLNNLYFNLDWTLTKLFALVQALGELLIHIRFHVHFVCSQYIILSCLPNFPMASKPRVRLSLFLTVCLVLCSCSFSFCFKRCFISS